MIGSRRAIRWATRGLALLCVAGTAGLLTLRLGPPLAGCVDPCNGPPAEFREVRPLPFSDVEASVWLKRSADDPADWLAEVWVRGTPSQAVQNTYVHEYRIALFDRPADLNGAPGRGTWVLASGSFDGLHTFALPELFDTYRRLGVVEYRGLYEQYELLLWVPIASIARPPR